MTPSEAFEAYQRFVNNHYAGNETWSDNIHDLYHHLRRDEVKQAVAVIHTIRAALNAIEASLQAVEAA